MFKNNEQYLGFNDFWFTVIGIIIISFLIPQVFFGIKINDPNFYYPYEWFEASIYTSVYWFANRGIMIPFRKRYPSFESTQKRLTYVFFTGIFVIMIISVSLHHIVDFVFEYINFPDVNQPTPMQGIGAACTSTLLIIAIYESIWYYSQLKKSIQEQERVKVAHVHSQLDGLRNQVNPHFLFNSLNTLNHIVEYEDKVVAKKFINQLSTVYRYILDSREETTIVLEEELKFVNAYINIQKERFLDNLKININIPQQFFYKKIIPLSLQLLIENAIKHNIISTKKPLSITIDIDEKNQRIRVINNLQKKSKVLYSTKVGLENIKERYRLLTEDDKVIIQETEIEFIVTLPLLT